MHCYGITNKGPVRSENQDSFVIEKSDSAKCVILSLCDGMGGAAAGGIASRLANRAFVGRLLSYLSADTVDRVDPKQLLMLACRDANTAVFRKSCSDRELAGMGTTIVGGFARSNGYVHIINVGDSRAYLIDSSGTKMQQITKDHSLVEELVSGGLISRDEAKNHPQKNIITRALGTDPSVSPDYFSFKLLPEETMLFCSDGLYNMLSEDEILEIYDDNRRTEKFVHSLMGEALLRGASDNVTIIAISR